MIHDGVHRFLIYIVYMYNVYVTNHKLRRPVVRFSSDQNPYPNDLRQDSLLAHAGRDLKQASTKDLATSFVERAGKRVFS